MYINILNLGVLLKFQTFINKKEEVNFYLGKNLYLSVYLSFDLKNNNVHESPIGQFRSRNRAYVEL